MIIDKYRFLLLRLPNLDMYEHAHTRDDDHDDDKWLSVLRS